MNAEDEVRHCRERIKDLEGEIYLLKMQLKNEKDRASNWQKAYDHAMTYAKDLLKSKIPNNVRGADEQTNNSRTDAR